MQYPVISDPRYTLSHGGEKGKRMSGNLVQVECPECKRVYTIYPGPDQMFDLLAKRIYRDECDFCQKEVEMRVLTTIKPTFSVGSTE
jgi:endogenous inhibitor of DNA gyrase (YacG/DUF329 family)